MFVDAVERLAAAPAPRASTRAGLGLLLAPGRAGRVRACCNRRLACKAGPVEADAQVVASIHVPQAKGRHEMVAEVCGEATPCAAVDPLKST